MTVGLPLSAHVRRVRPVVITWNKSCKGRGGGGGGGGGAVVEGRVGVGGLKGLEGGGGGGRRGGF